MDRHLGNTEAWEGPYCQQNRCRSDAEQRQCSFPETPGGELHSRKGDQQGTHCGDSPRGQDWKRSPMTRLLVIQERMVSGRQTAESKRGTCTAAVEGRRKRETCVISLRSDRPRHSRPTPRNLALITRSDHSRLLLSSSPLTHTGDQSVGTFRSKFLDEIW